MSSGVFLSLRAGAFRSHTAAHGTFCLQVADAAKKCADDFAASAAGPTIKRHAATRPKWQGLIDRFSKDCGFDEVAGISTPIEKVRPVGPGGKGGGDPIHWRWCAADLRAHQAVSATGQP